MIVTIEGEKFQVDFDDYGNVIVNGEKFEIGEDVIQLSGNPYHDNLGRFTSRALKVGNAMRTAGLVSVVASVGGGLVYNSKAKKELKKIGIKKRGGNLTKRDMAAIGDRTMFSKKIGGKEYKVSYDQFRRGTNNLAKIGLGSFLAGHVLSAGVLVNHVVQTERAAYKEYKNTYGGTYEERAEQARKRAEEDWARREQHRRSQKDAYTKASWPPEASEEKFKKMYRKLAFKYHPDRNPGNKSAEDMMKKINDACDKKDWKSMKDMFDKNNLSLEAYYESVLLEMAEGDIIELLEATSLLIQILEQALQDGSEYITFPVEEGEEVPEPFVQIDNEMVIDRITAQYIVDMWNAGIEE